MFVYIHVPFCRSRCIYCDFYIVLDKYGGQDAYVEALQREIRLRLGPLHDKTPITPAPSLPAASTPYQPLACQSLNRGLSSIESIYVGGGTPSLLPASAYQSIFETFREFTSLSPHAEVTLEANPKALADPLEAYRAVGFNRISIGIQSLVDEELKRLSRPHTVADAIETVQQAKQAGFENISIDLMYATPGQTKTTWQETLERAIALDVQHISIYGLKVESDTALERLLKNPRSAVVYGVPDEEANVVMYYQAIESLKQAGFEPYEISNLSKGKNYRSRHNLNYWDNGPYYAFGPAAHGYIPCLPPTASPPPEAISPPYPSPMLRYENIRDLAQYLENPLAGRAQPCPREEQLENAIIFGLRKREGISIPELEATYGIDFQARYGTIVERYQAMGLLQLVPTEGQDRLRLTLAGIPVSNAILADFLN